MSAGIMARFLGAVKIGRLYLSHRKGLIAGTTQTQGGATALDRIINYVSTVGVSGDGVKLPLFEESKIVILINAGANTLRLYSAEATGVTIGATAGATGVTLAAASMAFLVGGTAGRWDILAAPNATTAAGSFTTLAASSTLAVTGASTLAAVSGTSITASGYFLRSVGNALTAVGTNRATALQLAKEINNITTAASGTGVILPVGVIGMEIEVVNAGASLVQVYATASETIDTTAGSTGVALTNAKRCVYKFVAANTWISAQMGAVSA